MEEGNISFDYTFTKTYSRRGDWVREEIKRNYHNKTLHENDKYEETKIYNVCDWEEKTKTIVHHANNVYPSTSMHNTNKKEFALLNQKFGKKACGTASGTVSKTASYMQCFDDLFNYNFL